ncbi:MAG: DUF4124 domain-containing protein [Myxococcota bacterium]
MKARDVSRWALVFALAVSVGFIAAEGRAQAYKYKDEHGHVHFTENYYEVPEKFRKQLETRDMPIAVDPNAAAGGSPGQAAAATAFQDGVRQGMGRDLTIKQQDALAKWWKAWGMTWMVIGGIGLLANLAIHLGLIVHALTNDHLGWGLANFLIGVTTPFYLMAHVQQSIVTRLALLALYLSPGVIAGVAVSQVLTVLS